MCIRDSTCIAYLLDPDCIETKHVFTEIEIRSIGCYGRTSCDMFGLTAVSYTHLDVYKRQAVAGT